MSELDEAGVKRLVAAVRTALPASAHDAEIRVSLLPGMLLIRINWDPGGLEPRSYVSKGGEGGGE